MSVPPTESRKHALAIWQAAVAEAEPTALVRAALAEPSLHSWLGHAQRILVVGAGKAGAAMSAGVEEALGDGFERIEGTVNVPAEEVRPLRRIRLHAARPAGTNQPTAEGIVGTQEILRLVRSAGPDDVVLCLLSGGGSALMPSPVKGVALEDKQEITRLLHACGATINEMNCVRKHLSEVKGGRLARGFAGRALVSLIISDVIGDPLDVIASGPTTPDPTTFADALAVLEKYRLKARTPASILRHLGDGILGEVEETPEKLPATVRNIVIGNNARSLGAAQQAAESLGYRVLNLGSFLEGETRHVAMALAGIVRSIRADGRPCSPPACVLSGGETTVTLTADHGLGGRNQEFVLAVLAYLGQAGIRGVVALSGGTDGEDGPTHAAGAIADEATLERAATLGLLPVAYLARNDAHHFFDATGDLLRTGLTHTNVMDVRVLLVE
ncbi:MAG TPA: glycerate kinase [Gemmataceae bacterium]|nr:glycerate kinase [Gemmataceae bacterium]